MYVKIGMENKEKIIVDNAPEAKEILTACVILYWTCSMLSLASDSEITVTKTIESEFDIKEGKNNNGIANPVSSPYCFVAFSTVIPAYVRLRSEERRVGKECRTRWMPDSEKKESKTRRRLVKTWIGNSYIYCSRVQHYSKI